MSNNLPSDVYTFMLAGGQMKSDHVVTTWDDDEKFRKYLSDLADVLGASLDDLREHIKPAYTGKNARVIGLRLALILEELHELIAAIHAQNDAATLDALVDLAYVVIGMPYAMGFTEFGPAWDAVHKANMAKFPPCPSCLGVGTVSIAQGDLFAPATPEIRLCPKCRGLRVLAVRDATGKITKPAGWAPPDLTPFTKRR